MKFTKAKIVEIFGEYDPESETVLEFTERVADIALKQGRQEVVEFKCEECSTPSFIHLVIPIAKLKEWGRDV